jgi:hypothetical protein
MLKTSIKQTGNPGGYPKLMRYNGNDQKEEIIVLFQAPRCGTYITGPSIGKSCTTLMMSAFDPFHGSVTIDGDQ